MSTSTTTYDKIVCKYIGSSDTIVVHSDHIQLPHISTLPYDSTSLGVLSYNSDGDVYPITYAELSDNIPIDADAVCDIVSSEPCILDVADSMFNNTTITHSQSFVDAVNTALTDIEVSSITVSGLSTTNTSIVSSDSTGTLGTLSIGTGLSVSGGVISTTGGGLPSAFGYGSYLYYNSTDWVVGLSKISIGTDAGRYNQGDYTVAIGTQAGNNNQRDYAVAIGGGAGRYNQGDYAVAVGGGAGYTDQGDYAVAIGNSAGYTNQHSKSIVINASDTDLNTVGSGLYVNPIRSLANPNGGPIGHLWYNSTTKEICYHP